MKGRKILITARQARELDVIARQRYGLSTLVLMENAGAALADEFEKNFPGYKPVVVCGKGNNGGDGFVCARHLLTRGIYPQVFIVSGFKDVKKEAGKNLRVLRKLGLRVQRLEAGASALKTALSRGTAVIDALLGTGTRGEVSGIYKEVIEAVNRSSAKVLSVDIPSGLNADTGRVLGSCIRADITVTFVAPKAGMAAGKGPRLCGKLKVREIGVPRFVRE